MNDDAQIEALMKRCQQGFAGRPSVVYEQANQFAAACYGTIGKLKSERDAYKARVDELEVRIAGKNALAEKWQRRWEGLREVGLEDQKIIDGLRDEIAALEERLNHESLMLEQERAFTQSLIEERNALKDSKEGNAT